MSALRIRSIRPEEAEATAALIARVFPRDPSYVRLTTWYRWMLENPDHRWEYVRVVELDGKIVSHLLLVERKLKIRHGVLRAAGLSVVATHQDYQRRGLNRALINEALEYASQNGFALSLLDGIPDYYDRYGYAVVMPKYAVELQTVTALKAGSELEVMEVEAEKAGKWIPSLSELYERETERLTGPAKRDRAYWEWLLRKGGTLLLAKRHGSVRGYCWLEDDSGVVEEAVGADPAGVGSLVKAVADRARAAVKPTIRFRAAPDAPFARALLLEFGGRAVVDYPRNAGWMGRLLDLGKALEAAVPSVWTEAQQLCLDTDLGKAGIEISPEGRVLTLGTCTHGAPVARLQQQHLLQLMFGYASADELRARGELEAGEKTVELLDRLFPRQLAVLFPRDHF